MFLPAGSNSSIGRVIDNVIVSQCYYFSMI